MVWMRVKRIPLRRPQHGKSFAVFIASQLYEKVVSNVLPSVYVKEDAWGKPPRWMGLAESQSEGGTSKDPEDGRP